MKKEIVLAVLLGCTAVSYCDLVAAWDFSDSGPAARSEWMTWANDNMTNGASITTNGVTLTLTLTGTPTFNAANPSNMQYYATFEGTPLVPGIIENDGSKNPQRGVFGDSIASLQVAGATMTLSGLTAGKTYEIQFIGLFGSVTDQTLTISQDGAPVVSMANGANTFHVIYSSIFTFTATDLDTDVSFALNRLGTGNTNQQGIAGMIVMEVVPEPATFGMLVVSGVALMFARRKIRSSVE